MLGMVCVSAACEPGDACEMPTHVYLDAPLGGRTVYDGCSGEAIPYKNVWIKLQERIDREGVSAAGRLRRLRRRARPLEERFAELLRGEPDEERAETRNGSAASRTCIHWLAPSCGRAAKGKIRSRAEANLLPALQPGLDRPPRALIDGRRSRTWQRSHERLPALALTTPRHSPICRTAATRRLNCVKGRDLVRVQAGVRARPATAPRAPNRTGGSPDPRSAASPTPIHRRAPSRSEPRGRQDSHRAEANLLPALQPGLDRLQRALIRGRRSDPRQRSQGLPQRWC